MHISQTTPTNNVSIFIHNKKCTSSYIIYIYKLEAHLCASKQTK